MERAGNEFIGNSDIQVLMKILVPISTRLEVALSAALAVACHAALFGLAPASIKDTPDIDLAVSRESLEVTLLPSRKPVREPVSRPFREKVEKTVPIKETVRPVREKLSQSRKRTEPSLSERIRPEERLLVRKGRGEDPNDALARRASKLVDSLRFVYPRFALEGGLEGRPVLVFTISGAGGMERVELLRSSGHAVLDRSALRQANEQVRSISFPRAVKNGRPVSYSFEQPIRFRILPASDGR